MQPISTCTILIPFLIISLYCNSVSKKNAPSDSANTASSDKINVSGKRALLIGINDYPYVIPKLSGCVNDVNMMRSMLERKYAFPTGQITTLPNEKATRAAILKAFHDLITATKTGDTVVIFYSGHGSQISNPAETDGLDETIIPYDYRDSPYGALPITDNQISNMLGELSKKTTNITVILDCCHSGGATKDLLTGTEKEIAKDSRKAPTEDDFLPSGERSLTGQKLKDEGSKYVLLAGCRSDQKSYETKSANGIYGGMLTISLVNKLSSTSEKLTWPAVAEDLQTYIHQFYNQSPELVGTNKNSYIFGCNYDANEAYFIVQPGNNNMVTMNGGKAQNVTVGSTYKVYSPGTLDFNTTYTGIIQIVKVSDFSAEAKITSGSVSLPNCRVVEYTHTAAKDEKIFVGFLGNWKGAAAAPIKKKILTVSNISEDNKYPNIIYYQKDNKIITYSGRDTIHALESFPLNKAGVKEELVSSIVRWDKWFRVANIRNPSSKLKTTLVFDPAKNITLDKADLSIKSGTALSFNLTNNSSVPVYVYVIVLEDNCDISAYTLDAFKTAGQSVSEAIPAGGTVSCAMTASARPGSPLTRDVFKILFTSVATDFKSLEQNNSKSMEDGDTEKTLTPINKQLEKVADWVSIEKVIFITP